MSKSVTLVGGPLHGQTRKMEDDRIGLVRDRFEPNPTRYIYRRVGNTLQFVTSGTVEEVFGRNT